VFANVAASIGKEANNVVGFSENDPESKAAEKF
jgi:hypothetical protein